MGSPDRIFARDGLLWRLLSEKGREHWRGYAVAIFCMAIVAVTTGLSAWILRDVINGIFIERNASLVVPIALAILAIFLVKGIASYTHLVILARIGNRIIADLQMRMFDKLQEQRIDFFEEKTVGDLAARFSNNAQGARAAIELLATVVGRDFLMVIALLVVMVIQEPQLSLIAFLVAPPLVMGVTYLGSKIGKLAHAEFRSLARIVTTIQETGLGTKIVKAFSLEPVMRAQMEEAVEDVRERGDRMAKIGAAASPLMDTCGGLAIGATILYAGWRVVDGQADAGGFFSFIAALLMAYDPARRLARMRVGLRRHLVSIELMYELLDSKTPLVESTEPISIPNTEAGCSLTFEGVSFSYDGDAPALHRISFTAEAGKTTALVGPSGGGKSTVFALIQRFYDPDSGRILLNGTDVRDVRFAELRGLMSSVSQDPFLFSGTVRRNIGLGLIGAEDAQIIDAAKAANAHEFIMQLPEGYDSEIGEDGAKLSGGQRQRIAIARAMLRRAPILLLDEATAALDAGSEARVSEALDRLIASTTLVIAHRLSTVRHADKIIVIEGGELAQSGTHDALMAQGGLYKNLVALQFGDAAQS